MTLYKWIKKKYYQREGSRDWIFKEENDDTSLFLLARLPIRRHVKIKADANPYDPEWTDYFINRYWKRNERNK